MSKEAMKLALRVALENLDSMEPLGPTTEAVIDAAQKWYLAEQPAQIAGFDVVLDESMPPNTMKFVQPAPVQQALCLVRRLEGVADLRRIEGDHDEAAVIDEAVAVLKATPQAQP